MKQLAVGLRNLPEHVGFPELAVHSFWKVQYITNSDANANSFAAANTTEVTLTPRLMLIPLLTTIAITIIGITIAIIASIAVTITTTSLRGTHSGRCSST